MKNEYDSMREDQLRKLALDNFRIYVETRKKFHKYVAKSLLQRIRAL